MSARRSLAIVFPESEQDFAAADEAPEEVVELHEDALVEDPDADGEPTLRMPRVELDVLRAVATPATSWIPAPIVSTCSCCGAAYDQRSWGMLAYVGIQNAGAHGCLELRNCECHSTLAVEVVKPLSDWKSLPKTCPPPPMTGGAE